MFILVFFLFVCFYRASDCFELSVVYQLFFIFLFFCETHRTIRYRKCFVILLYSRNSCSASLIASSESAPAAVVSGTYVFVVCVV